MKYSKKGEEANTVTAGNIQPEPIVVYKYLGKKGDRSSPRVDGEGEGDEHGMIEGEKMGGTVHTMARRTIRFLRKVGRIEGVDSD